MAKRIFQCATFTPTATADTTAHANATYMALKGGSSTQRINVVDVYIGGQASTTGPALLQLAKSSTVATTPTALAAPNSDGPLDGATAALAAPPVSFTASAAGPQREAATTSPRMHFDLNAFGGVARVQLPPGEEWSQLGNTASLGESILSAFTGGSPGLFGAHMIYEPF